MFFKWCLFMVFIYGTCLRLYTSVNQYVALDL